MGKLDTYREYVRTLLQRLGKGTYVNSDLRHELVFDREGDHYQLLSIGWDNRKRVFDCDVHLDIINDKVWIQLNNTDVDLATELVEMGVPREDIVLGFHSPYMRQFTDYAVQ